MVYSENAMDIDFAALARERLQQRRGPHVRLLRLADALKQNAYTGMFQDKNLILFTAESFSPWFISEELTPTLYRLTHEGFVFDNFYPARLGANLPPAASTR